MIRETALTRSEFETLKAIGRPGTAENPVDPWALAHLMAADLVADDDGSPMLTDKGRAAIVRGSPKSWDLAA